MKHFIIIMILLFSVLLVKSQEKKDEPEKKYIIAKINKNLDTMLLIRVRPIVIYPERKFKNKREKRRYNRMIRNVKKVYPYSLIVKEIFSDTEEHLKTLETKKERKKYLKIKEKQLKKEFESIIRNMTFTQGRILIKLIYRETGHTSYVLIKHFQGSFRAVLWQSVARIFSTNLKYEYNAKGEDKWIEEIVSKIENGML